jgi:hypothetical protein
LNKESTCLPGTQRFDSRRCIKYIGKDLAFDEEQGDENLNWQEADANCRKENGRLLVINDLVDELKLSSLMRDRLLSFRGPNSLTVSRDSTNQQQQQQQFGSGDELISSFQYADTKQTVSAWVIYNLNKKRTAGLNESKSKLCVSKKLNGWQLELCNTQLPYICEFDTLRSRTASTQMHKSSIQSDGVRNKNRLIRVSCGSSATIFASPSPLLAATTSSPSQSSIKQSTLPTNTRKSSSSILNKKGKHEPPMKLSWANIANGIYIRSTSNSPTPTLTASPLSDFILASAGVDNRNIANDMLTQDEDDVAVETTTVNTIASFTTFASSSSTAPSKLPHLINNLINQELVLIVAVVGGFLLVLILVNVFCIWNYYK